MLAWIDGLGATGLDGHDLRELGLKNGNLTVDDRRNQKHWSFTGINASLTRPASGGLTFRLASENPQRPWILSAAMRPLGGGERAVGIEARHVSSRDILLALRVSQADLDVDLPLSGSVRADIGRDGSLRQMQGQLVADSGTIVNHDNEAANIKIDRAEIRFSWDPQHRALLVPFQIHSGGNQFTMRAILQSTDNQNGIWQFTMQRGDAVIDPIILASPGKSDPEGFAINRAAVRARIDTVHQRIDLEQGDFSRVDTRPSYNVGVAVTGSLDYSGAVPHLAFGVAGTRMPVAVFKRLWPIFVTTDVRRWVEQHVSAGTVERVVIAGNAPVPNFKKEARLCPTTGYPSISKRAARRCVRSITCRRSATPTSRCVSSATTPASVLAAAPWTWSRGASSALPAVFSSCRTRISNRRRHAPVFVSMAAYRRRPPCWPATRCAAIPSSRSIRPQAAVRSRPRSRSI